MSVMFHRSDPRLIGSASAPGAPRPHTVTAFDDDLRVVAALTVRLGGLAEDLLSLALRRLEGGADADDPRSRRARLSSLERELTRRAAALLALRQPVAGDLRAVLATFRLAAALGRAGDLATNLAERAAELRKAGSDPLDPALHRFGERALAQLGLALSAYQDGDARAALAVWRRDAELDVHFSSLAATLVERLAERPQDAAQGAQRLFLAKDLERVGDQARRIAAATWWALTGSEIDEA